MPTLQSPATIAFKGRLRVIPADPAGHGPVVNEWREAHGQIPVHTTNLPNLGTVAILDDNYAAYVGAYTDQHRAIAWMEWVTTRPGLSLSEARAATAAAIGALEHTLRRRGVQKLFGFVTTSLHREATTLGFHRVAKDTIPVCKDLTQPPTT
jgi:hypothetical protein